MNTITPIRSVRALRELADYLEGLPEDALLVQAVHGVLSSGKPHPDIVPFTRSRDAERVLTRILPVGW